MLEGVEIVAKIIARYAEVEKLTLHGTSVLKTQLAGAIVKLYQDVLRYLMKAKRYYSRSGPGEKGIKRYPVLSLIETLERFARSVVQSARSGVIAYRQRITDEENETLKLLTLVQTEGKLGSFE